MGSLKRWLVILFTLTLAACSGGESNVASGNREKILHFGNGTEPQDLDPHIVTGLPESHIISALLEGLIKLDPKTLKPKPGVAKSWEISEDHKTYTFNLREDARWSNGDPVTALDFKWTWWRALQPALGNQYAYMLFVIKNARDYAEGKITDFEQVGVTVVDDHTLKVELENPTPYFLQLLDHQSTYPLHRTTIEKFGAPDERATKWTRVGNYVGNGPFILTEWKLNKIIQVRKNPYYWNADNVRLNGIDFHPIENVSTEERMFRADQLHITGTLPIDKVEVYKQNHPELLQIAPYLGIYYYRFNVRNPVMEDQRIRLALNLAIDRKAIVERVTKGGEKPAYTFTPPNTMGYTATSNLKYDPERARELLAEAGYPDGEGLPTIELLFNTSEGHRKIAVALQQMWKKNLNIDVSLVNQDWKVFLNSVNVGDYTMARAGWIGDYVDPNTFLDMWVTGGGNNQTGWSNARYDELVLKLAPAAKTQEERYCLLREAEAILLRELPVLPIYVYTSKSLIKPSVHGIFGNLLDYVDYTQVWLSDPSESN